MEKSFLSVIVLLVSFSSRAVTRDSTGLKNGSISLIKNLNINSGQAKVNVGKNCYLEIAPADFDRVIKASPATPVSITNVVLNYDIDSSEMVFTKLYSYTVSFDSFKKITCKESALMGYADISKKELQRRLRKYFEITAPVTIEIKPH